MLDDFMAGRIGEASDKIYDDVKDIAEITSFPDQAPHRVTDKMVLAAGTEHGDQVKTAIVCPPTIYGVGRGPGNQRSVQIPDLIKGTLQKGHGFHVGAGKTRWSHVHVSDLSDLYLKLVENAAAGGSLAEWPDKPALWGGEAYFFSENGEHVWGEVSQKIASEAHKQGLLKSDEVKSISAEEAAAVRPHGQALWGCNSRSRASRARDGLKWKPSAPSIEDVMKSAVESEAKDLGLKPGHAAVAAGDA
jgi:nucleoside-diphosphate-sugar epimerase